MRESAITRADCTMITAVRQCSAGELERMNQIKCTTYAMLHHCQMLSLSGSMERCRFKDPRIELYRSIQLL